MNNIKHFSYQGYTPPKEKRKELKYSDAGTLVIVNCPTNKELLKNLSDQVLNPGSTIHYPFHIGLTRLHPSDQYNKKIGVAVALKKAESVGYYAFKFSGYCRSLQDPTKSYQLVVVLVNVDNTSNIHSVSLNIDREGGYPEITHFQSRS